MASSFPQLLTRSVRASRSWTTASAVASSSRNHGPSQTSNVSNIRSFSSSGSDMGPKAAPKAKTKMARLAKTAGRGIPKRKGADDNMSGMSLANRFYRQPVSMNHLPIYSADAPLLSRNLNTAMAYSEQHLAAFDTIGLEKKVRKSLYSYIRPVTLVRQVTTDLIAKLDASSQPESQPTRINLTGPISSGKSHLMLQAVSYAMANNWLTIYLPRLINLVDSTTGFAYSEQEQAYLQPQWVRSTLATILATNKKVLSKIKVDDGKNSSEFQIQGGIKVDSSSTLDQLLETASHASISPGALQRIFDLFLTSISTQTDVPVLFAGDCSQALFQQSHYVTPDMEPIESYELAPVRSLIRFLAGYQGQGIKRGAVISSISHNNQVFPVKDELQVILNETAKAQKISLSENKEIPAHSSIHQLHLEHAKACLSNTTLVDLNSQWSKEELKSLYEVRRQEGRNWNGGNAADADTRRAAMSLTPGAFVSLPGQPGGVVSEDELFLLRVLDSGGNPAKFEAAIRGASAL
ncbi:unnamed protein product [Sympodiomycopsis kandeliae]